MALIIAMPLILILILVGNYLFNINYGNNIAGVVVFMALFLMVVTGIGLFLATMVRTMPQLQALAPIVIVSTSMLGGCFWPLELVPPSMQLIGKFIPQYWVMEGLKDVVIRGKDLTAAYSSILMLILFSTVFFVLGTLRVKNE